MKSVPEDAQAPSGRGRGVLGLDGPTLARIYALMVKARLLEERLIKMSKGGQGFFWLGGPGEEAFNVPLGLLVKKGRGVNFDFLHLHYRSLAVLLAMGAGPADILRQMRSARTDPFSKGRQFVNHPAVPDWNVVPVTPTIETQFSTAIGTAIAQAREGGDGITVVIGGDGGTAEGDFHSCLVWANRPALPLPILLVVTNNGWAISAPAGGQHGEEKISYWGKVFDMPHETVDGNDPLACYNAVEKAMAYCRNRRRPYLLEARVSRLYGHSSSSGANWAGGPDCIELLERRLLDADFLEPRKREDLWHRQRLEIDKAYASVLQEPFPAPDSIWEDVYDGPLPTAYPRRGGS
ncbi:MAG: thiamine pyrophosphate-dependent dehydrogenase E1 component subunit alpha [Elusimicrobia bacterium]|nr:thiamine pyrophosphate-dependent dehydrogenase E1 component subunit alpha [Elusimicrobiota bacterium]